MSMTETDERETAEAVGEADPRSDPTQRVATLHSTLAEGPVEVRVCGATDVGLVREHNEDNFTFADLETGRGARDGGSPLSISLGGRGFFAAVCDGMGGAAAGEVASQMGVDTLLEMLSEGDEPQTRDEFARRLVDAIQEAGTRIFVAAKMDRTRRGMGTTSTVAGLVDKVLFVGQVGDSRAYVLRDGELGLITKDQSLVNQLIEAGQLTEEEAENFEHSNIILQALGTTERVVVDLTFLELRRGDRLMLCSDGLSGLVHSSAIAEVMAEVSDPVAAAKRLIELANAAGGHDNVTCVIADFDGEGLPPAISGMKPTYQPYPLPSEGPAAEANGARREPTVKTSTQKPGADVKRGAAKRDPTPSAPFARLESSRTPLVAFIVALIVVLLGALVLGVFSEDEKMPVRRSEAPSAPPPPVDVHVTSDVVGGEHFIDGKPAGELSPGQITILELPPGAYRFDARVEDTTVVSSVVTVHAGRSEAKVDLSMPSGVGRDDDLEDDYEDELEDAPPLREPPAAPAAPKPEAAPEAPAAKTAPEPAPAAPKVAPSEPKAPEPEPSDPGAEAPAAEPEPPLDPLDLEELDKLPAD